MLEHKQHGILFFVFGGVGLSKPTFSGYAGLRHELDPDSRWTLAVCHMTKLT